MKTAPQCQQHANDSTARLYFMDVYNRLCTKNWNRALWDSVGNLRFSSFWPTSFLFKTIAKAVVIYRIDTKKTRVLELAW